MWHRPRCRKIDVVEAGPDRTDVPESAPPALLELLDGVTGALVTVVTALDRVASGLRPAVVPGLSRMGRLLPRRARPGPGWQMLVRHGRTVRTSTGLDALRALDVLVPLVTREVVRRLDLTELIREHVDLDALVRAVDLDAAARGLDLDAVVDRLDVAAVVDRVDLDSAAAGLDVDAVAARIDVDAVLDRIDLTAIVLDRVDLGALVDAVLARVDLAALAVDVIDAVDLPEIIRESTGALSSDAVRGARLQGIAADEAVGRLRDRLLLRRGGQARVPVQRDRRT
jgi:hypothetical protein